MAFPSWPTRGFDDSRVMGVGVRAKSRVSCKSKNRSIQYTLALMEFFKDYMYENNDKNNDT